MFVSFADIAKHKYLVSERGIDLFSLNVAEVLKLPKDICILIVREAEFGVAQGTCSEKFMLFCTIVVSSLFGRLLSLTAVAYLYPTLMGSILCGYIQG